MRALVATLLLVSTATAQVAPPQLIPPLSLEYTPAPLVPTPDGPDTIVALKLNQPAPFAGQLLETATAIRWVNYLEQAKLRLREDVLLERRTCNANMEYYSRRVALEQGARKEVESDLRDRLLRSEQKNAELQKTLLDPGIFKSTTFWFVSGVVTSGVLIGLSALALNQAR